MNSYVQFVCLVVSFLYGILLYYLNKFNYTFLRKKGILVKVVGSGLYLLNVILLYILFLYKINSGMLHIYFILFMILGYAFISVKKRK